MASISDIFEQRNNLMVSLLVLVKNGGIGPEWMFDDARDALESCGNPGGNINRLYFRILNEAIESEEEFDGQLTERSIEYRRLLEEFKTPEV